MTDDHLHAFSDLPRVPGLALGCGNRSSENRRANPGAGEDFADSGGHIVRLGINGEDVAEPALSQLRLYDLN